MKETRIIKHSFKHEDFLEKLGLDGDHVLAIESISMKTLSVSGRDSRSIDIALHIIVEDEE